MGFFVARTLFLLLLVSFAAQPAESAQVKPQVNPDPLAVYKSGDFERALPLLQATVAAAPQDEALNAALLSSLVYQGQVDAASDAVIADEKKFPNSPVVIAARGEFAYYMGDMQKAETLFRQAIKLKEPTARAYLGMYRLYEAASMYHTARLLILRAHAIDPDDALITRTWMAFLPQEEQEKLFGPFAESHPWLFKGIQLDRLVHAKIADHVQHRKVFELEEGERREVTIPLIPIFGANHELQALGLQVRLNDGKKLTLVVDTGASGVVIRESAARKVGLSPVASVKESGIGDEGPKQAFIAVADACSMGSLNYKTCLIRATAGNLHLVGDEDGLIGTDVFSSYLVEIDFRKPQLHLTPLPPREPNPSGYDSKGPDKEWTRVFRYGHLLFVPTDLNGKTSGLFLIDTGSSLSNVDSTFARLSTKIQSNGDMNMYGMSGKVNELFRADKAVITFAGYRQRNIGLTSFNLNNFQEHHDVRIAGLLGFPVLVLFRLTIDYRNGLVKFEYKHK